MSEDLSFEPIEDDVQFSGRVIRAGRQRFRYADGTVVMRDRVWHPGAVGILAVDDECVWLVRQPREVAGLSDSLEIPAGKRDVEGEVPLATAQRELAEEVGLQAAKWRKITGFYPTLGFADEFIHLYEARGLSAAPEVEHPEEDERISVIAWPLDRLDEALTQTVDSKTLIALLWLARELDR